MSNDLIVECVTCANTGWVCEDHNNKPWSGGMPDDFERCCGGAGAPCPVCNPCDEFTAPRELTGSIVILDHDGFHPHVVGGKDKK